MPYCCDVIICIVAIRSKLLWRMKFEYPYGAFDEEISAGWKG